MQWWSLTPLGICPLGQVEAQDLSTHIAVLDIEHDLFIEEPLQVVEYDVCISHYHQEGLDNGLCLRFQW